MVLLLDHRETIFRYEISHIELHVKIDKIFHHFENHRKKQNTILVMKDEEGIWVRSHGEIIGVGVRHFQHIYKDLDHVNIVEILTLASSFSRFVTKEHNDEILERVSKEEQRISPFSFKKYKILGSNGWSISFSWFL